MLTFHRLGATARFIVLVVAAIVLPVTACAQDISDRLWSSISFEKDIYRNLTIEAEQQLRLEYLPVSFRKTFTELTINSRISPNLTLSGKYRLIITPDDGRADRISLCTKVKIPLGSWTFGYRLQGQREWEEADTEHLLRNRPTISYALRKSLRVYIEGELFQAMYATGFSPEKYRLTAGFNRTLSKRYTLKGYFRLQWDVTDDPVEIDRIIGIKNEFSF